MYYYGPERNSESENRWSTLLRDLALELFDQVLYSIPAGRLGGNSGGRESVLQDHGKFREYSPPGFVCRNRGCRYDTLNYLGFVTIVGSRFTWALWRSDFRTSRFPWRSLNRGGLFIVRCSIGFAQRPGGY